MRKGYIMLFYAIWIILIIGLITFGIFLFKKFNSKSEMKVDTVLSERETNIEVNEEIIIATSAKEQEEEKEIFFIKEKEGFIVIYKLNVDGKEEIEEVTEISVRYLPELDQIKLKEGIKVEGREKLISELENYE